MSSASLALVHTRSPHAPPDRLRITALSAAMAVNLAVFLVALRPLPPAALPATRIAQAISIRFITPPAPTPPPPPIELRTLPAPVTPLAPSRPVATPRAAPPVTAPAVEPMATVPQAAAAPLEASLAYRAAPLEFPAAAVRQRMHGTVLLRVLVDTQGRPLEAVIEHSSGYGLLDRSAREQVLASWQFQPAVVHGQPVRAWARVPVSFDLREL